MVVLVLYGSGSKLTYLLVAKETHDIMCTYHMYMHTKDKERAPNKLIVYICVVSACILYRATRRKTLTLPAKVCYNYI